MKIALSCLALWICLAWHLSAEVVINEICYDPEGSDESKEWIELYNNGSSNEQLAIMVALNLSHELLLEKNRIQQYSESMEQRIRQLNDVIQEALKEQSKLSVDDCN